MNPAGFPQANTILKAAPGDEASVEPIMAWVGTAQTRDALDGARMNVVAWKPDAKELEQLAAGGLIYLVTFGGLPPHHITADISSLKLG